MKQQPELELLADIAVLLKKYGPETFDKLAGLISSPEFTERLTIILGSVARTSRITTPKRGSVARGAKATPLRDVLQSLRKSDPQKYQMISSFHTDLIAGEILPTMRDIRSFAAEIGVRDLGASSRDKALGSLVRVLASLEIQELVAKLAKVSTVQQGDRDLEGWTSIILNTKNRPNS